MHVECFYRHQKIGVVDCSSRFLTNGPGTGNYSVIEDLTGVVADNISRRDVADFMIRRLYEPACFRRSDDYR